MSVIAFSSDFGSEGASIAHQIAQRLGLTMLDHSNVLDRLAGHGFTLPDEIGTGRSGQALQENNWRLHKIGKIISSEILFLAQKNNMMLLSPYAPYLLAGIAHIPRIRVRASLRQRTANIAAASECGEAVASQKIHAEDAKTNLVLASCFGVDSPDRPEHFDLIADTGWLTPHEWTEQILELVQDDDFLPTSSSLNKLRALASGAAAPAFSWGGRAGPEQACASC